MRICEYCFNDEELKAIIKNNNGTSGICPNCGAETILYDTFLNYLKVFLIVTKSIMLDEH